MFGPPKFPACPPMNLIGPRTTGTPNVSRLGPFAWAPQRLPPGLPKSSTHNLQLQLSMWPRIYPGPGYICFPRDTCRPGYTRGPGCNESMADRARDASFSADPCSGASQDTRFGVDTSTSTSKCMQHVSTSTPNRINESLKTRRCHLDLDSKPNRCPQRLKAAQAPAAEPEAALLLQMALR